MRPVTVSTTIRRPREEVFEYLADIANHQEFTDHFLTDWRLTREDSYGAGAGARFRIARHGPVPSFGDTTIVEAERPTRLVLAGRTGRLNRIPTASTWMLEVGPDGGTEVQLVAESEPFTPIDRLVEKLSAPPGATRRQHAKALKRLQTILESGEERGARATLSGGPRKPATGFRL